MIQNATRVFGSLAFVLALLAGCGGSDGLSPSAEIPTGTALPTDSAATIPTDSTLGAPIDSTLIVPGDSVTVTDQAGVTTLAGGTAPGIVFGSFDMKTELLGGIHTGSRRAPGPGNILPLLAGARAKGARLVISLTGGGDANVKNTDGTFSLAKWKAKVAEFKSVNFSSYISDGTILGHYLIDQPNQAHWWGGKVIPQATVEAMAAYSKQLWPGMITLVRVVPTWLASTPITYTYLDAAWAQYTAGSGDPSKYATAQVGAAKAKRLGIIVGLNILNGGNGSSHIPGTKSGQYAMSASELRTYGTALLNQSYSCGFYMWTYDAGYYGRSDIKSAMTDLSSKAKAHVKTSCRQ